RRACTQALVLPSDLAGRSRARAAGRALADSAGASAGLGDSATSRVRRLRPRSAAGSRSAGRGARRASAPRPARAGGRSPRLEAGRRALLHVIAGAHRAPRDEFTVVFDGARRSGGAPTAGRIRVVFSRPPLTADDELMRLARQMRSGAVVVSSDRKIQDAARRAGS